MLESRQSRLFRWRINTFPAYRRTGGRVTYISGDFREWRVELRLTRRTKNLYGTLFGGSMYGCVDPIYAVMLFRILGAGHLAWDKRVQMRFLKPGRNTLYARFRLPDGEVEEIRRALAAAGKVDRGYEVELVDRSGEPHAWFEKTITVRKTGDAAA